MHQNMLFQHQNFTNFLVKGIHISQFERHHTIPTPQLVSSMAAAPQPNTFGVWNFQHRKLEILVRWVSKTLICRQSLS